MDFARKCCKIRHFTGPDEKRKQIHKKIRKNNKSYYYEASNLWSHFAYPYYAFRYIVEYLGVRYQDHKDYHGCAVWFSQLMGTKGSQWQPMAANRGRDLCVAQYGGNPFRALFFCLNGNRFLGVFFVLNGNQKSTHCRPARHERLARFYHDQLLGGHHHSSEAGLAGLALAWTAAGLIWVWVKIKPPGDHRF